MTTLVSVVIPVRNGVPWVIQALSSIKAQSVRPTEIVAVDDHSTDATVREMRARWPDVSIVKNDGVGIAAALNTGLRRTSGDWIMWQDADDWSRPDRLAALLARASAEPSLDVIASLAEFAGSDSQPADTPWTRYVRETYDPLQSPEQLRRSLPLYCCLLPPTMLMRRAAVERIGGFDERYVTPAYDFLLRLLSSGAQIAKLSDAVYTYRIHAENVTRREADAHHAGMVEARLAFVAREAPGVSTVAVVGRRPRVDLYMAQCARRGWTVLDPVSLPRADLVIVADVGEVPVWEAVLSAYRREGNCFIR